MNWTNYIEHCKSIVPFRNKKVVLSVVEDDGVSKFLVKANDKLIRNFMEFELLRN
ncbi:MAG: hypothetical protein R2753_13040 [Chitinophagales bacterium]